MSLGQNMPRTDTGAFLQGLKAVVLVGMKSTSAPRHTELSGKHLEPVTFALCLLHRLYVVGRCFLLCSFIGSRVRAL